MLPGTVLEVLHVRIYYYPHIRDEENKQSQKV